MTTPAEREYVVFRRGEVREDILRFYRLGLRAIPDPRTGEPYTEDIIRQATATGGRFWIEAEAIDLLGQGLQKKDEFLAQQIRVDRAGSAFLRNYHSPTWKEPFLPATGGSGRAAATGLPGTTWQGSTIVPDPFATSARDAAGNRYQVLFSGVANAQGQATLTLIGVDTGEATNLPSGAELRWTNPPPGSTPTATTTEAFRGGGPEETDAAFAARLASRIRNKPGAGNAAQVRALGRDASNAVEDVFVYPCALNAGSVAVAVVQKRGSGVGPNARLPTTAVLTAVTERLVPPASPVLPAQAFVVVTGCTAQPSDVVVHLAQRRGSGAGWTDLQPFPPAAGSAAVLVSSVASQTDFRIDAGDPGLLPDGVAGPLAGVNLMVWDVASSSFETLQVQSVQDVGGGQYRVLLVNPPAHTIALDDAVSPAMQNAAAVAAAAQAYFDSLGPGELVDLATSTLAVRAFRRPTPSEEWPARAGQSLLTFLGEGLGAALADAQLASLSVTAPDLPDDPVQGPRLVTLGTLAVYALE